MKYDALWWIDTLTHVGVLPSVAHTWGDAFAENVTPDSFSSGEQEIAPFTGQALYETAMLTQLSEQLGYSAQRLQAVWPARFPSLASTALYAFHPEALANFVYGNRMGNTAPGDGYLYRGRGIPMITGKANYALVSGAIGVDLVASPSLLQQPDIALRAAVAWWEKRIPDSIIGDNDAITHRVQGGAEGAAQRGRLTTLVQQVVGVLQ